MPHPSLSNALDRWQRDPFRLFFPLGAGLLVAGIAPWLLFGLSAGPYLPAFHATAQVQGFLSAFAVGFLFTFIPRRTATAPPERWELVTAALATSGVVIAAFFGGWWLSQLAWLTVAALIARFVLRRVRVKAMDPGLIWVPLALALGVAGTLMLSATPLLRGLPWLHGTGQALLTQGVFTGLCLGIGRVLFPIMLHRHKAPPLTRAGVWFNTVAAALFVSSFAVEVVAPRLGWSLRALVTLALVLFGLDGLRLPSDRGLHRWALWLSAWMIPAGYLWLAAVPAHRLAALHLLFIGGFATMVIAVSTHVVLAHGGHATLIGGAPWPLRLALPLLVVAAAARAAMAIDPARLTLWSAVSSAAFLVATALWLWLLGIGLFTRPRRLS